MFGEDDLCDPFEKEQRGRGDHSRWSAIELAKSLGDRIWRRRDRVKI